MEGSAKIACRSGPVLASCSIYSYLHVLCLFPSPPRVSPRPPHPPFRRGVGKRHRTCKCHVAVSSLFSVCHLRESLAAYALRCTNEPKKLHDVPNTRPRCKIQDDKVVLPGLHDRQPFKQRVRDTPLERGRPTLASQLCASAATKPFASTLAKQPPTNRACETVRKSA